MFCKIIIRNTDSTLSFVVCQRKRSMNFFLIFNFITDHISRPCSLLSALPSLISKMLYGGEKGDPFPLLFFLCSRKGVNLSLCFALVEIRLCNLQNTPKIFDIVRSRKGVTLFLRSPSSNLSFVISITVRDAPLVLNYLHPHTFPSIILMHFLKQSGGLQSLNKKHCYSVILIFFLNFESYIRLWNIHILYT